MGEEHVLQNSTKLVSYSTPHGVRYLENAVQFGATLFITDFTGQLADLDDVIWDALTGQRFKVGSLEMVKIGDNVVEFSPGFRRYLITDTPMLQVPAETEARIVRIELERHILQVCHLGTDVNGMAAVSCSTMGGTEVARLHLSLSETDVAGVFAAIAKHASFDALQTEIVFPNGASSR